MKVLNTIKPTRVIWIYMFGFMAIMIFAALWWPLSDAVSTLFTTLQSSFPTEMSDPVFTFINNVWTYGPPIFLFALLIWSYIQSQKRPGEYA